MSRLSARYLSRFLAGCSALLWVSASLSAPGRAEPTRPYPHGDGTVRIFNYHLNEFSEIHFREGNRWLPEGLAKADRLLRSRDNSEEAEIDPRLLDLLDYIQDHFGADEVEVISGYRRKEFNDTLLHSGHTVSPVSLHTKGQAIDIHLDEIREETLRDFLLGLKLGGVGYYGPLDFVHIDVGPVRQWGEGRDAPRKLVGVLQPEAAWRLTSDKNDYLPGERLLFTWEFPPGSSPQQIRELRLEHFHRGQWLPCPQSGQSKGDFELPASDLRCGSESPGPSFGKFRWTFRLPDNPNPLSSNEFYFKKQ